MAGCCNRCCRCCAAPKTSIALTLIVMACIGISAILFFAIPKDKESCSDLGTYCYRNDRLCEEGLCYCESRSYAFYDDDDDDGGFGDQGTCEELDESRKTGAIIAASVFEGIALLFLLLALASCCCFGCLEPAEYFDSAGAMYPTNGYAPNYQHMEADGYGRRPRIKELDGYGFSSEEFSLAKSTGQRKYAV